MVNYYTYLEPYLENINKQFSLSDFEKYFSMSHQTIKNQIKTLVDAKILIEEKKVRFRFYTLNKENPALNDYLSICEKERSFNYLNKMPLVKRLYTLIAPEVENILIFGSAVNSNKFNDIDMLVISKNDIKKEISDFETTYSVKIHLIQAQKNELTKTFLTEIRKKHIILKGHDFFMGVLYNEP